MCNVVNRRDMCRGPVPLTTVTATIAIPPCSAPRVSGPAYTPSSTGTAGQLRFLIVTALSLRDAGPVVKIFSPFVLKPRVISFIYCLEYKLVAI